MSTAISRRTIAKGAAWATPAILATATVPSYAASSEEYNHTELAKSMQGVFLLRRVCNASGIRLNIESRQTNGIGFWVTGAKSNSVISNASFTVYIANSIPKLTWTRLQNTGLNWTVPVQDNNVPVIAGYTAYTTYYTKDNWTYDPTTDQHSILDYPNFTALIPTNSCPARVPVYSLRYVSVDGKRYELRRGPATLT